MLNKLNIYIFKRFLYSIITFIIFAAILFIGDFVEQLRKSTGKNISLRIIFQLTTLNFLNHLFYFAFSCIFCLNSIFSRFHKGSEKLLLIPLEFQISNLRFSYIFIYLFRYFLLLLLILLQHCLMPNIVN